MALSLLLALLFAPSLEAKTVVLKAPKADAQEYRAFVLSSPVFESASSAQLASLPSAEDRETLAAFFAKAQTSFMQGSLTQAQEDFRAVVALVEVDQWKEDEQSVFLHSYLRLAQLSHRPEDAGEWMKQAVIWAPNGVLDEKFFPPPLIEKFKQVKSDLPKTKIDLSRFADDFDYAVINGRVIALAQTSKETLPEGPLRATFISDTYQTMTVESNTDLISQAVFERKPWVEGSCQKFQTHWQASGSVAKPFFSNHCAPLKKPVPEVDIAYHSSSPEPLPTALPVSSTKTNAAFYEKTWFWIGVGAVATAIVVASLSKTESQPTSHEGF